MIRGNKNERRSQHAHLHSISIRFLDSQPEFPAVPVHDMLASIRIEYDGQKLYRPLLIWIKTVQAVYEEVQKGLLYGRESYWAANF
jgi:hypothetical protein